MLHTHEATGSSPVVSTKTRQIRTDLTGFLLFSVLFRCAYFLASGVTHALTHTGIDWDRTGQHRTGFSRPVLPFSEIFLLHRLADDRADGVRRVLLHLYLHQETALTGFWRIMLGLMKIVLQQGTVHLILITF